MTMGMRCSVCKSENVRRDADAAWHAEVQEWGLVAVYDNAVCEECGGETRIEEFEIEDSVSEISPGRR